MTIPQFNDIISLSNPEIVQVITETENELFQLRCKKATRGNFKSHEIRYNKRKLAQLKTLLTLRLKKLEQEDTLNINPLITKKM